MSKTIDERVVEMRFDNKEFEKNVAATRKSLRGLDEDLAFKNASKGFRSIEQSSDDVDFNKLSNALTTVTGKFSTLEIIGITALQNITNKAVNAGIALAESLTIKPLEESWSGFEQLTLATQALVGSGKVTGEEAEEIVENISWLADEISTKLQSTVDNISRLVSANVIPEDAFNIVEGLNILAITMGKTPDIVDRAVGHLSKGLSKGFIGLGEFSYAFEETMLAGPEFRDNIIRAGLALGELVEVDGKVYVAAKKTTDETLDGLNTIVDGVYRAKGELSSLATELEVTPETIRQTATEGEWITEAVINEALRPYYEGANAVRQYMEDHPEIETSADAIQAMLEEGFDIDPKFLHYFEMGMEAVTLTQAIESAQGAAQRQWINIYNKIFGGYEQQKKIWTDLSNQLWDITAGPVSIIGSALDKWKKQEGIIGYELNDVTGRLEEVYGTGAERTAAILSNVVEGIVKYVSAIQDTFLTYILGTSDYGEQIQIISDKIDSVFTKLFKWSNDFKDAESNIQRLQKVLSVALKLIVNPIKSAIKIIKTVGSAFKSVFGDLFPKKEDIYGVVDSLDSFADSLVISESTLDQIGSVAKTVLSYVRGFVEDIWPKVKSAFTALKDSFLKKFPVLLDDTVKPFDKFKIVLLTIYYTVKHKIRNLAAPFMEFLDPVIEKFKSFKDTVFEKGKSIFNTIKEDVTSFGDGVKKAWQSIVEFFKSLDIDWKAVAAIGLAASALILMLLIYDIYWTIKYRIMTLADGAKEVMDSFAGVLDGLSKSLKAATLAIVAVGILILSVAIFNLYLIFKQLSKMSWDEIEKASVAMAVLAGVIAVFAWGTKVLLSNSKNIVSVAIGLLILAAGLTAMIVPIARLYTLSKQIGVGALIGIVTGILAAVAILVLISKVAGKLNSLYGAAALLAFVASLGLLEIEILLISRFTKQATKGVLNMLLLTGALFLVALVVKKLDKVEFGKIAFKILAVAIALTLLTASAIVLGLIPLAIIAKGVIMLIALSLAFLAIGGAAKLLGSASKKMLIAAVAILAVAASIAAIGYAIYYFSDTQWENIKNGVIYVSSIAGALVGLVALLALITRLGKGNKALLGAGVAIVSLAAGILAIAEAIKILSGIGSLDESVMDTFISAVILFIIGAIVIVGLIALTNSKTASKALLTASVMILSLSVLAVSIGAALLIISLIPPNPTGFWAFTGIVLLIVGALSVMVAFISKSNIKNFGDVFKSLALAILSFSVLIAVIVGALALMQLISFNPDTFWAFAGLLAGFIGLVIAVVAILKNSQATTLAQKFSALAILAGVFGIVIVAVAASMSLLNGASMGGSTLSAVIIALTLFIGGIIAIVAMLKSNKATTLVPKILAISVLAAALGGAISGIIASISLLNGVNISGTVLAAVIVAIIALVGAVLALSLLSKTFDSGALLAVSAAVISMAAAIIAIGLAVMMIQSVDGVGTLWALFGVMALLIVIMVGAAAILTLIPGSSLAIAAIGAAIFDLSISMLLTAVSVLIFTFAIKILIGWINQLAEKAGGFKALGEKIVNDFVDFIVGFAAALRERAPEIGAALLDLLIASLNILWSFMINLKEELSPMFAMLWPKISGFFKDLWEKIPGWLSELWTAIKKGLKTLWDKVSAWFGGLWTDFIDWGKDILDGIKEGIKAGWEAVKQWFIDLWNGLVDKIDIFGLFKKDGEQTGEGFVAGVKETAGKVKDTVSGWGQDIKNGWEDFWGIHSPSKVMREDGEYLGQGFEQGVTESLDDSRKPINKSMERLADDFDESADKSSSSIIDKLKEKFGLSDFDITKIFGSGFDFSSLSVDSIGNSLDLSSLLSGLPTDGEETELNFTAVVDSSQIDSLYSGLSGSTAVPVGAYTTGMAYDTSASVSRSSEAGVEKVFSRGEITDTGTVIYNTFQVNGDNAQELADEIASILQGQIERKANTWA